MYIDKLRNNVEVNLNSMDVMHSFWYNNELHVRLSPTGILNVKSQLNIKDEDGDFHYVIVEK